MIRHSLKVSNLHCKSVALQDLRLELRFPRMSETTCLYGAPFANSHLLQPPAGGEQRSREKKPSSRKRALATCTSLH